MRSGIFVVNIALYLLANFSFAANIIPQLGSKNDLLALQHLLDEQMANQPDKAKETLTSIVNALGKKYPHELYRLKKMTAKRETPMLSYAINLVLEKNYGEETNSPWNKFHILSPPKPKAKPEGRISPKRWHHYLDIFYALPFYELLKNKKIEELNFTQVKLTAWPITILQLPSLKRIYVSKGFRPAKDKFYPPFLGEISQWSSQVEVIEFD